jgi:hypothetical protein
MFSPSFYSYFLIKINIAEHKLDFIWVNVVDIYKDRELLSLRLFATFNDNST